MQLDYLQKKLDERVRNGNNRKLTDNEQLVDLVSNDYLGLSRNEKLFEKIYQRALKGPKRNGGTGSRLLSGNYKLYQQTEVLLAKIFQAESALIFNSGYAANQALVSSVADKGDTILYDQLSHVCLKEGAWLSRAATIAFAHNDLNDLEVKLKRSEGRVFVLTESIFSMDGDVAPLADIVDLCEKYEAYLIVDEAHSTGVYGHCGSGMLVQENLHDRVFARVYTFGKAMGVHGACVAGSRILTDYLINFGRPFIYTTSLPPHSIISIEESFRYLGEHMELQGELKHRIRLLRDLWQGSSSHTAIQPVLIGSNEKAKKWSSTLQQSGFDVRPVLSPTVKKGTERLRVSLHVHNTEKDIKDFVATLQLLD